MNAVHDLKVELYKGDAGHDLRVIGTRLKYKGLYRVASRTLPELRDTRDLIVNEDLHLLDR